MRFIPYFDLLFLLFWEFIFENIIMDKILLVQFGEQIHALNNKFVSPISEVNGKAA